MRRCILFAVLLAILQPAGARAGGKQFEVTVTAGKTDRSNTPVCVPLSLPKDLAELVELASLQQPDGKKISGQLVPPGLLTESIKPATGEIRRDLHFILPALKAGDSLTLKVSVGGLATPISFTWHDTPGEFTELRFARQPVLRYVDHPFDDSTKEKREETFKVYHHLYDPSGKAIMTKGPGGLYTHHRGIFYGFKATYEAADGKKVTADTWHCPAPSGDPKKPSLEAHLEHEKILSSEAGPVLGRHRVQIGWFGRDKERFAVEERELTVYNVPGGQFVEFASKLTPVKGTVKLDGDPQHAGFHFRAVNEVDKNKGQTYFLRPFGKGEMGKETNFPQDKQMADLPWNAMSFVVGDKRYTAAYLDRPENPKEARYSERSYGRFGSYFVAECSDKKPLTVAYRLWLQEGEMTKEGVEARSADFVKPPTATVK
jgi:Methane oxygenase PmoA